MGQADRDLELSEATGGNGQGDGDGKVVPVAESIRYRKRAQAAEQQCADLAEQLNSARDEARKISGRVESLEVERELTHRLVAAGTVDVEGAVLIASEKLSRSQDADVAEVVDQMVREKGYLFGKAAGVVGSMRKGNSAKDRQGSEVGAVESAARRAVSSGDRVDLQEYMKVRRGVMR